MAEKDQPDDGGESNQEEISRVYSDTIDDKARHFLTEDYKLKVDYLTAHFGRMWTRFNFFLTIQLAVFGFLGYLLFDTQERDLRAAPVPIILGILTALIWFVVGVQDRVLVDRYRNDVKGIATVLANQFQGLEWYKDYYVGSGKGSPGAYYLVEEKQSRFTQLIDRWLFSRYWGAISITRLAAILPLVLFLVWCIILLMWLGQFWIFCECWWPPTPESSSTFLDGYKSFLW